MTKMDRIFIFALLIAVVSVMFALSSDAVSLHHNHDAVPHNAHDDCGCICHLTIDAMVSMTEIEIHQISAAFEHFYDHSFPQTIPASLERPPKLFS